MALARLRSHPYPCRTLQRQDVRMGVVNAISDTAGAQTRRTFASQWLGTAGPDFDGTSSLRAKPIRSLYSTTTTSRAAPNTELAVVAQASDLMALQPRSASWSLSVTTLNAGSLNRSIRPLVVKGAQAQGGDHRTRRHDDRRGRRTAGRRPARQCRSTDGGRTGSASGCLCPTVCDLCEASGCDRSRHVLGTE